ncbi:uncharacterized protein LOC122255829 isoform X2 [Penaeus japonicus]|uniref:uncharacterized protein LOC122255829 isoform X2 n=1 Tax=Penaeus japonicus TaxID=27405 RepID=UPI001C71179D|nr:uncharacterized protein LOC122255829 isoform X2 [Penaeus japonicus]
MILRKMDNTVRLSEGTCESGTPLSGPPKSSAEADLVKHPPSGLNASKSCAVSVPDFKVISLEHPPSGLNASKSCAVSVPDFKVISLEHPPSGLNASKSCAVSVPDFKVISLEKGWKEEYTRETRKRSHAKMKAEKKFWNHFYNQN